MKVRIGNDIRLAVDLRLYLTPNKYLKERQVYNPTDSLFESLDDNVYVNKKTEVYYPGQYENAEESGSYEASYGTNIGIRSVEAVLINTTRAKAREAANKKMSRFVARFPIEPDVAAFRSTQYNIHNSGYPTWRAYPHAHVALPYKGFGLNPQWDGLYKPLPAVNEDEYHANVYATEKQNVVEVSFPAEDQLHTGKYTLVIRAKLFAPGFNQHNLKTITIDIPDAVELVSSSYAAEDADVVGSVTPLVDILPDCEVYVDSSTDVYVKDGSVSEDNPNVITLTRTDGETVSVDVQSIVGWGEPDK